MERKILVTGATGKQGRALIASLQSASGSPPEFQILALTRSITSPAANALKAYPNVQLVQGDLDQPETVRKVFDDEGGKGSIWGMYVVLAFPGLGADASGEERQGKVSIVKPCRLECDSNLTRCSCAQILPQSMRCHIMCSLLSNVAAKSTTKMLFWTAR